MLRLRINQVLLRTTNKIIALTGAGTAIAILVLTVFDFSARNTSEAPAIAEETPDSTSSRDIEFSNIPPASTSENIIFNGVPPYFVALPILDDSLYVMHASDQFRLGGSNLGLIRYAASIRPEGSPTIQDRGDYIEFKTSEQPYIEFSYDGNFYSIRITTRSYSTIMEIRQISGPTVELNRKFGG